MWIRSVTKIERPRHAILVEILSGRLRPGQRLLEARLSKKPGVSKATVNAALQDLHNLGLVTKTLQVSTNGNSYTRDDIDRLFHTRVALEPLGVEAFSAGWSEEARRPFAGHMDQMHRAGRAKDLGRWGIRLHLPPGGRTA